MECQGGWTVLRAKLRENGLSEKFTTDWYGGECHRNGAKMKEEVEV